MRLLNGLTCLIQKSSQDSQPKNDSVSAFVIDVSMAANAQVLKCFVHFIKTIDWSVVQDCDMS